MQLHCSEVVENDLPDLPDIVFAAFSDPFHSSLFPPTEAGRQWWLELSRKALSDPRTFLIKVEDNSLPTTDPLYKKPVGWARWTFVEASDSEEGGKSTSDDFWPSAWQTDANRAFMDDFFGRIEKAHAQLMGKRRHYFLEFIVVLPRYQSRGVGRSLLQWGCGKADEIGVECYLDAAPTPKLRFERYGFRGHLEVSSLAGEAAGGQVEHCMIRPISEG